MFGIAIITHGKMSEGIADALEVIFGSKDDVTTINLYKDDDISDLGQKIEGFLDKNKEKDGIFLFTDLQDASPYNQSLFAVNRMEDLDKEKVYVISGVNLPLILEVINHNLIGSSVEETVAALKQQAETSIHFQQVLPNDDEDDFDDGF